MKRKIFSVLFALVLVLSFSLVTAVPAAALDPPPNPRFITYDTDGDSIVENSAVWSSGEQSAVGSSGTDSIHFITTEATTDYAEVAVPTDFAIFLLGVIDISYWGYTAAGHGAPDETFLMLWDGSSLVVIGNTSTPAAEGEWTQWTLAGSTGWYLINIDPDSGAPSSGQPVNIEDYSAWRVVAIGLGVGTPESSPVAIDAYVDLLVMDGTVLLDEDTGTIDVLPGYMRIQDAINAALPGTTVTVAAGTYVEDLTITGDKTGLELAGADGATIQGAITIAADDVTVTGFIIKAPTAGSGRGIDIGNDNATVSGNTLEDWEHAIWVQDSTSDLPDSPITLASVTILGNTISDFAKSGIVVKDTLSVKIEDNIISTTGPDPTWAANGIQIGWWDDVNWTYPVTAAFYDETATTGTIKDNHISGSRYAGYDPQTQTFEEGWTAEGIILIVPNSALEISGNELYDNNVALDIVMAGAGTTIENNDVHNNTYGFISWALAPAINFNNIYDNARFGVYRTVNTEITGTLDATNNWWGDATGADHASNNPHGTGQGGDAVSDDVVFTPWYATETTTSGSQYVSVDHTPNFIIAYSDTIQGGIDAALAGDTVNVAAGTYAENLYIYKSLTVQGADVTELIGSVWIALGWDDEVEPGELPETAVFDGFNIYEGEVLISIYEVKNGSSLTISNNVLEDFIIAGIMSDGSTVDIGSTVTIEDNYIVGFGGDYGIYFSVVAGGSTVNITDNLVVANYEGIYIGYLAGVSTVNITGNLVADNYQGISIDNLVEGSTVAIEGNLIGENYYGIEFNEVNESTVTIAGNTIGAGYREEWGVTLNGNYGGGIYFYSEDTVSDSTITIQDNVIVGNGHGEGDFDGNGYGEGGSGGIYVDHLQATSSLKILNNDILDNYDGGVYIGSFDAESTVYIHYNSIAGNDNNGVYNDSAYAIDATNNWWGDATGADHSSNPHGTGQGGDAVSDDVNFTPWYATSTTTPDTEYVEVDHAPSSIIAYSDTIQGGIDAALAGDTVTVAAGTYAENVVIDESLTSLTLQGEDKDTTIIDGGGSGVVVAIEANNVTVSGFTVTGSGASPFTEGGIGLLTVTGCIIKDNIVSNNAGIGIGLHLGSGNTIENNILVDNSLAGIGLSGSINNFIKFNSSTGTKEVAVQISDGVDYKGYGIVLDYDYLGGSARSTGNIIDGNTFSDNEVDGVYFGDASNGNTLTNNIITNNGVPQGVDSHGVYFWGSDGNTVTGNTITGNLASGVQIYQGADNTLNFNNISGNGYGIDTDTAVDAEDNWWGSASGPTHPSNGLGTGDAVSDYVDYIPWLDAEDGDEVYLVYIGTTGYDSIQTAIDEANPYDTITVAPGTYVVDTTITISKDLTLSAPDGAKLTGTDGAPVVTIEDYNVTLDGFEIDPGTDGVNIPLISIDNVVTIENSVIFDNTEQGIDVGTVLGTLNILNNIIAQNTQEGIRIAEVDNGGIVVIQGNVVGAWEDATYDLAGNGNAGIEIFQVLNGSSVTIGGAIEAEANIIAANVHQGIYVEKLYHVSTLTIEGNTIGAYAYDDYTFAGNGFASNAGSGFYIYYVDYGSTLTIRGNMVAENSPYGIEIEWVGWGSQSPETEAEYNVLFQTYGANTVTIEDNYLGAWEYDGYSFGGNIDDGLHIYHANFVASTVDIHLNSIVGNTVYGINQAGSGTLDATNNWWGSVTGPDHVHNPDGVGDVVSDNVLYNPWLLTVEGLTDPDLRYEKTLALKPEWTIVSPDAELSTEPGVVPWTAVGAEELKYAYDYIGGIGAFTTEFILDPITPMFIKTTAGGGIGFNYAEDSWGLFTTNLEAGWNLIGIPRTGGETRAILSPLRYGVNSEIALATLASQGQYNPSGRNFNISMMGLLEWSQLPDLHEFDGYWAYMNVAKEFGVVVVEDVIR